MLFLSLSHETALIANTRSLCSSIGVAVQQDLFAVLVAWLTSIVPGSRALAEGAWSPFVVTGLQLTMTDDYTPCVAVGVGKVTKSGTDH